MNVAVAGRAERYLSNPLLARDVLLGEQVQARSLGLRQPAGCCTLQDISGALCDPIRSQYASCYRQVGVSPIARERACAGL